jgi:hypothetical protein
VAFIVYFPLAEVSIAYVPAADNHFLQGRNFPEVLKLPGSWLAFLDFELWIYNVRQQVILTEATK